MAVAWRSMAHTTYGGNPTTSITIPKPAGLAVDDILLAVIHIEMISTETVSASGFTLELHNQGTSGIYDLKIAILWKRATAGDVAASDFTFSWTTSAWSTGDLHAFSGCTTSGSPITGSAAASSTTTTIPSINYTAGNGLGIWVHTSYSDGLAVTLPAGYTQQSSQNDGSLTLATRSDAGGATSTGTGSVNSANFLWAFAGTLLEPSGSTVIPISFTKTL